jgi:hypothetical protein
MTEIGEFRIGEEATLEDMQKLVEHLEDGMFLTEQDLSSGVVKISTRDNEKITEAA